MGLLRSETMKHGTIILPSNAARFYVNLIGYQSNLQIQDMNAHDLHRPYRQHIQRLEDMDRMIRFLLDELRRLPGVTIIRNRIQEFLHDDAFCLDSFEEEVKGVYEQYVGFRDNNKGLSDELTAAIEEKYVMHAAYSTLSATTSADLPVSLADPLLVDKLRAPVDSMEFGHICGVIDRVDQERFARTLFRAARGNSYTHFEEIPELLNDLKSSNNQIEKSVFVTYFQGGASSALYDKFVKICQSFQVSFYDWPATKSDAQLRIARLEAQIVDKKTTLAAFEKYVVDESAQLVCPRIEGGNSLVEDWRLFAIKEKSIYAVLNMFTGGEHHLTCRADCWFPASEEPAIKQSLATQPPVGTTGGGSAKISATIVSDDLVVRGLVNPPTHFRKSEFTGAFQELVDTYGVPRYQEANPALFAIVTFPFIFGIMYGDIGHGSLLLAGGIYMLKNGASMKLSDSDLVKGFYSARYLITAMGFFAVYAGLMYNDFFSLGTALFTTRYEDPESMSGSSFEMVPKKWFNSENSPHLPNHHGPYPFGLDPAWLGASNELLFVNSMKMKLSVLFGVVQMLMGVALKFANSVFFKNKTDFIFECIPQLLFMLAFFGYMDWMIMYKWVTPITLDKELNGPPGIINSMITMALGTPDNTPLYLGQTSTQSWLMFITMISVPLMLIPKPIILYLQNKKSGQADDYVPLVEEGCCAHADEHEEFEIGEVVIHQMIETIEYVLGTVSHTASYLRLWALSLAHQQLSLVFFQKALIPALVSGPILINGIWIYIAFTIFFAITAGVLLGMDVMECFLHTLRLHWVEFQSKFYKADGYAFAPYSHEEILTSAAAPSGSSD